MIRRFGALLSVSFAMVGCFEPGGGQDEVADASTGESEATGESESSSTSTGESESSTSEASTSESETTSESTSEESTTGEPEPVCGNGLVEGDEVCDDGPMPELMPGACAPDCSTVIEVKRVKLGAVLESTDFGNNPVAFADSTCEPGYKAMFAYGNLRVATTVPWETVDSVDWPIQRYTAYVNNSDKLIWITDETRLLTVRGSQKQEPVNPLYTCNPFCLDQRMVTGMLDDGTNAVANTCNGWTSIDPGDLHSAGSFFDFDLVFDNLPCRSESVTPLIRALCVEQ